MHKGKPFILAQFFFASFFVLVISLQNAGAEEERRLELGIGIGAISVPHYRGADEQKTYVLPYPFIRYEGKRLKVNREGGHFYFIKTPRFHLNVSVGFTPPTNSDDNKAREDMPDLDAIFEFGPRAEFHLYESKDKKMQLRAAFPLRQAIVIGHDNLEAIGFVFSPYLQWRYLNKWRTTLSIGPIWGTEAYHHYFYEVEPQYATASRPAYDAHGGYNGTRLTFYTNRRFDHSWFGFFARYDTLSGATFMESPLVKQNDYFVIGAFIARIFLNGYEK